MSEELGPDYKNAALIVWDMQYGIASRAFNLSDMVPKIKSLIDAFHRAGRPVIYSQHTGLPYEYMSKAAIASMRKRGFDPRSGGFMLEGSRDWRILDELSPAKDDLVLRKHTASFFVGTYLDQLLRNRGVDTLVLVGVSTEAGIEGTARHASYLGYLPVIVEDAIGSANRETHDMALAFLKRMFTVQTAGAVVDGLKTTR